MKSGSAPVGSFVWIQGSSLSGDVYSIPCSSIQTETPQIHCVISHGLEKAEPLQDLSIDREAIQVKTDLAAISGGTLEKIKIRFD